MIIGFLLIVFGIIEYSRSKQLPAVTDEAALELLMNQDAPSSGAERKLFFKEWYRQREALDGGKYPLSDAGQFDIAAGAILMLAGGLSGMLLFSNQSLKLLKILGLVWPAAICWGVIRGDILDLRRDFLHHSADSISLAWGGVVLSFGLFALISWGFNAIIRAMAANKTEFWPAIKPEPVKAAITTILFLAGIAFALFFALSSRGVPGGWYQLIAATAFSLQLFWLYQTAMTPKNTAPKTA